MPTFIVVVEGTFNNRREAEEAMSSMEDMVGRHNGDLTDSKLTVEDEDEEDEPSNNGFCEDYPCCGHEYGDCFGQKYGSDESIKAAALERMREEEEGGYFYSEED